MKFFRRGALIFLACFLTAAAMTAVSGFFSADGNHRACAQKYPNISGRVLFENALLVVQRFSFPPGQWEGVHSHPPNQIFIHLKGGRWTIRYGRRVKTAYWPTASFGWHGAVTLKEDHESKNSGTTPIDLMWVTFKLGCGQARLGGKQASRPGAGSE